MNNKGQSVLAEYVTIFFIAIAAMVGITAFVQRGLQARIHDARNYMIDTVVNSGACDANCMQATGNSIGYEYEPYYMQMFSASSQNAKDNSERTSGNPAALGAIYYRALNETTKSTTVSIQLPPECADGADSTVVNCAKL